MRRLALLALVGCVAARPVATTPAPSRAGMPSQALMVHQVRSVADVPREPPSLGQFRIYLLDAGLLIQGHDFTLLYNDGRTAKPDLLGFLSAVLGPSAEPSCNPEASAGRAPLELDHLILSHPRRDRADALPDLFRCYKVKEIWEPGRLILTGDWTGLGRAARLVHLYADGGLVVRVDLGATRLLLMGGAEGAVEELLLTRRGDLDVDFLQASATISPAFLEATSPGLAVLEGPADEAVLTGIIDANVRLLRPAENSATLLAIRPLPGIPLKDETLTGQQLIKGFPGVVRLAARCTGYRGEMTIELTIEPTGRVSRALVTGGPVAGTAQAACVERTVVEWARFDSFDGPPTTSTLHVSHRR
jgi:hypothetical protein